MEFPASWESHESLLYRAKQEMLMRKLGNHIMQLRQLRTQDLVAWLRLEPRGFSRLPCLLEPF